MKFQLLIKTKLVKNETFVTFKLPVVKFIMLINVKINATLVVGILTLISTIEFHAQFSWAWKIHSQKRLVQRLFCCTAKHESERLFRPKVLVPPDSLAYRFNSYLQVSSADNLCKQFGPWSGPTKCPAWSGSKLFDFLTIFLKEFLESLFWKKISRRPKNHAKLSSRHRVIEWLYEYVICTIIK